jgi:hypothetical protein
LAFTGWEPAHFQVSAGIVIRMFGRDRQIAEQRPLPPPSEPVRIQPTIQPAVASIEVSAPFLASIPPAAPVIVAPQVLPHPVAPVAENLNVQKQPPTVSVQAATPVVTAPEIQPVINAKVIVPTMHVAQSQPAPQQLATVPRPPVIAQPQPVQRPQSAPMSLGEYARRLREKKQQEQRQ